MSRQYGVKGGRIGPANRPSQARKARPPLPKQKPKAKPKRAAARQNQMAPFVGKPGKLSLKNIPSPATWKFACADAGTRATRERLRSTFTYNPLSMGGSIDLSAGEFDANTLFVYSPACGASHLVAVNRGWVGPINAISRAITAGDRVDLKTVSPTPNGVNDPANSRYALAAACVSIQCMFPMNQGTLNIRRQTVALNASSVADILDSLDEDVNSTWHYPLTGSKRITMPCGIHDAEKYGVFCNSSVPVGTYQLMSPIGSVIFSFSGIQNATAVTKPSIVISGQCLTTVELTTALAHYKDNAPERSVVTAKEMHGHQARHPPVEGGHNLPEQEACTWGNTLVQGGNALAAAMNTGATVIGSGAALGKAAFAAAADMQRASATGRLALAAAAG